MKVKKRKENIFVHTFKDSKKKLQVLISDSARLMLWEMLGTTMKENWPL